MTSIYAANAQTSTANTEAKTAADDSAQATKVKDQTQETYVRPDADARRKRYVKSIFGPIALARTVVGAGFGTWRNSPVEWGDKWEGFGRRVASGFVKNAINQTIIYGLDEFLKLDSAFYARRKKMWRASPQRSDLAFYGKKTKRKRTFGIPRVVGTYASSIIAYETWYPEPLLLQRRLKNRHNLARLQRRV